LRNGCSVNLSRERKRLRDRSRNGASEQPMRPHRRWVRPYEELFDRRGDGFRIPGELVTRKDAGQSILKRCQTCAPDVPAHVPTWPSKRVTGLGAGDLGRLLRVVKAFGGAGRAHRAFHGHPIESILYEPGSVTVRTSQAVHRFDVTDAVQLDIPAATSEQ
jgi:hypothetical protein